MNDQNLEEPSRYVSLASSYLFLKLSLALFLIFLPPLKVDLKHCHYLVDLATENETPREPRYAANKDEWSVIAEKPFLDASK